MQPERRPIRLPRIVVTSLAGFALLWHVLPVLVWHAHVRPVLASAPNAHRLRVPHSADFERPAPGWTRHDFAGVELFAPLEGAGDTGCGDVPDLCQRAIPGGKLSIARRPPGESHAEMVNLRAPDERDLSIMRSAAANWATIRALRDRVTTSRARLESWRYSAHGSRGVVAETDRSGRIRYVVVAYPHGEGEPRMIGIVGGEREIVLRIIGSIRL